MAPLEMFLTSKCRWMMIVVGTILSPNPTILDDEPLDETTDVVGAKCFKLEDQI